MRATATARASEALAAAASAASDARVGPHRSTSGPPCAAPACSQLGAVKRRRSLVTRRVRRLRLDSARAERRGGGGGVAGSRCEGWSVEGCGGRRARRQTRRGRRRRRRRRAAPPRRAADSRAGRDGRAPHAPRGRRRRRRRRAAARAAAHGGCGRCGGRQLPRAAPARWEAARRHRGRPPPPPPPPRRLARRGVSTSPRSTFGLRSSYRPRPCGAEPIAPRRSRWKSRGTLPLFLAET